MKRAKDEIMTFKVDEPLAEALRSIPNRSEFIRSAVAAALEGVCPLCQGTGTLTMDQKRHWEAFAQTHELAECDQCSARHLVCQGAGPRRPDDGAH